VNLWIKRAASVSRDRYRKCVSRVIHVDSLARGRRTDGNRRAHRPSHIRQRAACIMHVVSGVAVDLFVKPRHAYMRLFAG